MLPAHQILVHFPIALLTVYALFELARFKRVTSSSWWAPVKAAFVIIGSLSSLATFASGQKIIMGAETLPRIVEVHRSFGILAIVTFGLMAVSYAILLRKPDSRFAKIMTTWWIAVPLALLGLFFITGTGALGGAMVFGPDIDPAARFFFDTFVGE